jgi:hypothetical protein
MKLIVNIFTLWTLGVGLSFAQIQFYTFPSANTISNKVEEYFLTKSMSSDGNYVVVAKWNAKLSFFLYKLKSGEKIELDYSVLDFGNMESIFPALNIYWHKKSDLFVTFTAKNRNSYDDNEFAIFTKNKSGKFNRLKIKEYTKIKQILKSENKNEVEPQIFLSDTRKAIILSSSTENGSQMNQNKYLEINLINGDVKYLSSKVEISESFYNVSVDCASQNLFCKKRDLIGNNKLMLK